jgi:alpha-tubulin suppressor-like RCC1 family protein
MRATMIRLGALATAAALSLAACSDVDTNPVAPSSPDRWLIPIQPKPYPTIIIPGPDDFMEIAAGGNHTCARQYDGDVYCWGQEGQAGYQRVLMTPTRVFTGARQIAVGGAHACALNSASAAYCWGGGQEGQLGIGLGAQIGWGSGWVLGPKDPNNYYGTLAPLAFNTITASGSSTCGTASSGMYCWGLAGSVNPPQFTSIPTQIPGASGGTPWFTQVAIGNRHVCGYYSWGGNVDCYGADESGQAGSDPNNTVYYPGTRIVIVAMSTGLGSGVRRVAAQGDFTCADMTSGTVQCFGYNWDGELGNASGGFTWIPQAVGSGQSLSGVATGSRHACALDVNQEAWCWGYNYWGMVGNGTWSYNTQSPQKVLGVSTGFGVNGATVKFRALAAGTEHTCGIGADNHIYCWGHNNYRQLGTWLVDAYGNSLTYGWVGSPVLVM